MMRIRLTFADQNSYFITVQIRVYPPDQRSIFFEL